MLLVQVDTQNISPLSWEIESEALEGAEAMLMDLLTVLVDEQRGAITSSTTDFALPHSSPAGVVVGRGLGSSRPAGARPLTPRRPRPTSSARRGPLTMATRTRTRRRESAGTLGVDALERVAAN